MEKHEFRNGRIVPVHTPMSGASLFHVKITTKIIFHLMLALAKAGMKNDVLGSDIRIWLPEKAQFVYPDVVVMGEPVAFYQEKKNTVTNPLLIVEVLSDSTEAYDRGEKFNNYATLDSFREYVLVSQHEPSIQVFYREAAGSDLWQIKTYRGMDASCTLNTIGAEIKLAEVYEGIDFSEKTAAPGRSARPG